VKFYRFHYNTRLLETVAIVCRQLYSVSWFKPLRFPYHTHIWRLLYNGFICQEICCFLSGFFVFTLQVISIRFGNCFICSFDQLTSDTLYFSERVRSSALFYIYNYLFTFNRTGANADVVHYVVSHSDFKMKFSIFGIDTTLNCNTDPNLEFISFIWNYLDRFDFMKYSMTLVRRAYLSLPELLCPKYYRAESGGWRSDVHCSIGITRFHSTISHLRPSPCLRTRFCKCMYWQTSILTRFSVPHPLSLNSRSRAFHTG
jgi:hypothetical protein